MSRGPSEELTGASGALVDYMGLLFVPAGATVMGFGALLFSDGVAIAVSLIVSTGLAIVVGGLAFGERHSFTLERSGRQQ
ncbi:MAG TPA: CidA/LrgA family protein [Hyphomicrobiaceae bacterium]|nr:CidA/LrgA family protein [Hyphomicrobiaceae bacterium]